MTWFQLVEAQHDDPEPVVRSETRLVPNSALFVNPALPLEAVAKPRSSRAPLRLVKGSRVDPAGVPSAA